jgi:hypothetical protein
MSQLAKGTHIVWSRQESTSTDRTNYAEILLVLETILGTAATPRHHFANHNEFHALRQDLLPLRRSAMRRKQENNVFI